MNTGRMRYRVTFQTNAPTKDSFGGTVDAWSDAVERWAEISDQGGREFKAAGVMNAETTTLFRIRYFTGLTPAYRISYKGNYYDILSVNEGDKPGEEMLLQTKVKTA